MIFIEDREWDAHYSFHTIRISYCQSLPNVMFLLNNSNLSIIVVTTSIIYSSITQVAAIDIHVLLISSF